MNKYHFLSSKIGLYTFLGVLLLLFSLNLEAARSKRFTVVIDAGHGGKDSGAIGYGYREKDIVLSVAKKLGERIRSQHPNVRVLYTRKTDVFVGLQARADFANKNKASLFISIHANSVPQSKSASGTETYVLGLNKRENNLSVARRENQVMLLEDNYKSIYKGYDPNKTESRIIFDVVQEAYIERSIDMADFVERAYRRTGRKSRGVRQEGLWVLSQSAMPAILTEIGFISNKSEAEYMASSKGQNEIAKALSEAFTKFYLGTGNASTEDNEEVSEDNDNSYSEDSIAQIETSEAQEEQKPRKGREAKRTDNKTPKSESKNLRYKVQFMSTPQKLDPKDKSFKRLKRPVQRERLGSHWVYTIGNSRSLSEAKQIQQSIRKWYRDSFIVSYEAGKRIGRVN